MHLHLYNLYIQILLIAEATLIFLQIKQNVNTDTTKENILYQMRFNHGNANDHQSRIRLKE